MKKKYAFFIVIISLVFTISLKAQIPIQTWLTTLNSGNSNTDQVTSGTEGFIINANGTSLAYSGTSNSQPHIGVISTSNGNVLFQNTQNLTGSGSGLGFDVNNNLFSLSSENWGSTGYSGNSFLRKFNSGGSVQFENTINNYTNDFLHILKMDNAGRPFIYGINRNAGNGFQFSTLYCYNNSGTLQWSSIINDLDWWFGYEGKMLLDSSGNTIFSGKRQTSQSNPLTYDIVIRKVNPSGSQLWQIYHDYNNLQDGILDLAIDNNGDIYFIAGNGPDHSELVKLSGINGSVIWQVPFTPPSFLPHKLKVNSDGNIILVDYNGTLKCFNPINGTQIWTTKGLSTVASLITTDRNGRIYNFGSNSDAGSDSIKVFNSSGSLLYNIKVVIPGYTSKLRALVVDADGNNFYVAGQRTDLSTSKIIVAKYSNNSGCSISGFNPLQDTTRICGISTTLDAGGGYVSYNWNAGATTQSISPTTSGIYKVTVTNAVGCTASDSTYLSIINASIEQNDTTIYRGTSITLSVPSCSGGGATDIDGNVYPTVTIGNQVWFAENLRVSRYTNGDLIPNVTNNALWSGLTTGAWSYYNNNPANNSIYGKLYNWFAITDTRNACPAGWHVPSDVEWTTLENTLGGTAVAGGKMKSVSPLWTNPNTGATNSSGFSGLPGGLRHSFGPSDSLNRNAHLWSSTERDVNNAWVRTLRHFDNNTNFYNDRKQSGLSVRCLKNNTSPCTNYSILWSTGATTTTITVSPLQTTTYYVSISNGITTCTDSVTVTVNPVATVNPVSNQVVCYNSSTAAIIFSSPTTGGSIVYNWINNTPSIGLPASGTGNIATFIALNTTNAPVTAIITVTPTYSNGGISCVGTPTTFTITVNPLPSGNIITPSSTIICQGSTVNLTASGGLTYQWFLNGIIITGATSGTYNAAQPGIYTVQLINSFGCTNMASNSIVLTLVIMPTADFSFDKYCAGISTNFTNLSNVSGSGAVSYSWNFGDGGISTQFSPTYTYTQPGNFIARLTVTPATCPNLANSISKNILVQSPPQNLRYPIIDALANRPYQLQARNITGSSYLWIPATGLNTSTIINPIFNYDRQQQYFIRINTIAGCILTDTILVRVFKEKEIYVPGGFSPNGDGKNEKLTPILIGIQNLNYFKIFDRWGQLMYQTNRAGEGWDGIYRGAKQPFETYSWIAVGIDIDGLIIKRIGSSILLR